MDRASGSGHLSDMSGLVRSLTVLVALVLCAPSDADAQAGETDVGEVSAFTGATFGAGTHPLIGGSSGFAFSRRGMAFIEGTYSPMGKDILWPRHNIQSPQDSHLFDVMVSGHIRFPIRQRWAPYALIGGGLAFNQFRAIAGPEGALIRIDDFKFAFQTGGGLRYYIGETWGIRPEFKVVISSRTYTRMSVGVFYTLPPNWP